MTVTFKLQTTNGLVAATVSDVASYGLDGSKLTLRRIRMTLAENGRPSLLKWTEHYENVSHFSKEQ